MSKTVMSIFTNLVTKSRSCIRDKAVSRVVNMPRQRQNELSDGIKQGYFCGMKFHQERLLIRVHGQAKRVRAQHHVVEGLLCK